LGKRIEGKVGEQFVMREMYKLFSEYNGYVTDKGRGNNTSWNLMAMLNQIHQLLRYGQSTISERHRHRYEYNSEFVDILQNAGLKASVNPDTGLVEIVEIEDHPFSLVCNTIQNTKTVCKPTAFVNFVAATVRNKKKLSLMVILFFGIFLNK
jgi:CTP synthase (UTP-ammonia lyase)